MTTVAQPQSIAHGREAGFWIRVGAFLIDGILIGAVTGVFTGGQAVTNPDIANPQHTGISNLASFLYYTLLWSSIGGGQTVGMRLLGLRVIDRDGKLIGYWTSVLRYFGLILSFVAILIGVIWVAFDPRKQGWHDKIAGTFVVHVS